MRLSAWFCTFCHRLYWFSEEELGGKKPAYCPIHGFEMKEAHPVFLVDR